MTARIAGYVSRTQAGLVPPRRTTPLNGRRMEGVAVHHGAGYTPKAHSECAGRWRDYQRIHMNDPNDPKVDIAYSYGVCPHGYVFEGRGWKVQPGANGIPWKNGYYPNRTNFAVCAIGSGNVVFSELVTDAIEWCINECRTKGNAGNRVRPHSFFASTSCPDTKLRAWAATIDNKPIQTVDRPLLPHTYRLGDRSEQVAVIQTLLRTHGYPDIEPDGVFGPITDAAVRDFQARVGIFIDGIVGEQTLMALKAPQSEEDELMALKVKNPVTGAEWSASQALWSIWHYTIEARNVALEARELARAAAKASGLTEEQVTEASRKGAKEALSSLEVRMKDEPDTTPIEPAGYVSGVRHPLNDIEDVDQMTENQEAK